MADAKFEKKIHHTKNYKNSNPNACCTWARPHSSHGYFCVTLRRAESCGSVKWPISLKWSLVWSKLINEAHMLLPVHLMLRGRKKCGWEDWPISWWRWERTKKIQTFLLLKYRKVWLLLTQKVNYKTGKNFAWQTYLIFSLSWRSVQGITRALAPKKCL